MFAVTSCATPYRKQDAEIQRVFNRVYLTDFNTAWQSVLDALKNSRMDIQNREGGFLQTKMNDNTAAKNFVDSSGIAPAYLKAQYRFRITVAKGFYNNESAVKVSVIRDQMVQKDVLEGWKNSESDTIEENTLLYRIGRIIWMRTRIAQLEEEKTRRELEKSGF